LISTLIVVWSLPFMQAAFTVSLDSPAQGAALQGLVSIEGNTDVDDFVRYRVEFSALLDSTGTWFVIRESAEPVRNGVLAEWDTTGLSDATYSIRLIVELDDAEPEIREVHSLRVRNYTPIETDTPAPTATLDPGQTATPSATPLPPTATSLPSNPASVGVGSWVRAIRWGIIFAFVSLVLLGLYSRNRR
jgi:hypothetical protein